MKKIFNYAIVILLLCTSCASDDDAQDNDNGFLITPEKETYAIEITGTHPTLGAINSKIEIPENLDIRGNQITLKTREGAGSRDLTILFNFPADKTTSGKKESIGIYLHNNNETDIWTVSDDYQLTNLASASRRASLDYIIEDNGFYNDTRNFSDRISIIVEDNRLKGSFTNISAKYSNSNNGVKISGTFDADLLRLNQ